MLAQSQDHKQLSWKEQEFDVLNNELTYIFCDDLTIIGRVVEDNIPKLVY